MPSVTEPIKQPLIDDEDTIVVKMPAEAGAKKGIASRLSALLTGVAWAINLGPFGWEAVMPISKVGWWLWIAYLITGISSTVAYANSPTPIHLLLSVYFTMYSALGLLAHSRELYLCCLWMATASPSDVENPSDTNGQRTSDTVSHANKCSQQECGKPAEAAAETRAASGSCAGLCATLAWLFNLEFLGVKLGTSRAGKVFWWIAVAIIIFSASMAFGCSLPRFSQASGCKPEDGDQLACAFCVLHGIMSLLWHTREMILGRCGRPAEVTAPALLRGETEMTTLMPAGLAWVLNLEFFGWRKFLLISKLLFWAWVAYILFGIKQTVALRNSPSPVHFLLSIYFLVYATLGFLWHTRDLYLGSLLANSIEADPLATPIQSAPLYICPACCRMLKGRSWSLEWILSLRFLGPDGARWSVKILWWSMALSILVSTSVASLCSHPYWGPAIACNTENGDQLFAQYWVMYVAMHLLSLYRNMRHGRYKAEGVMLSRCSRIDETKPKQAAATPSAAGSSVLGWVFSLRMFGWGGATMLTKIIFWLHIPIIIILAAISLAYWTLPGKQWMYTLMAVLYTIQAFLSYASEISLCYRDGFY